MRQNINKSVAMYAETITAPHIEAISIDNVYQAIVPAGTYSMGLNELTLSIKHNPYHGLSASYSYLHLDRLLFSVITTVICLLIVVAFLLSTML